MATASFVTYLQKPRELPVPEFRAPPPSPVTGVLTGSSSGSSGYGDDDEIGKFLRCSARIPVLRLPERPVPRRNKKKAAWAPPVIDMRMLESPSPAVAGGGPAVEALKSAAVEFGCFQVVGHGIDGGLLLSAASRAATAREGSPASEETEGIGGGDEDSEELWWPPGEGEHEMAENWPLRNGAKQIRNRADDLFAQLEQASTKLLHALQQGSAAAGATEPLDRADANGSLCIRKHERTGSSASGPISHDDVLRMLVRSSQRSRSLALHLCPGASAFHVFSRRGWSRFHPVDGAAVVTVGDQLQAWSGGLYKSVSGEPAFSSDDLQEDGGDGVVSTEFFLSGSSAGTAKEQMKAGVGKIVPLNLQVMVAACLVLLYHFLMSFLCATW